MKRYSASYVYERSNFALIGCDVPIAEDNEWHDLACVTLNIIQRGTPTPAPSKLSALLGKVPELNKIARPVRPVITHTSCWGKTIKGAPDGSSNPALHFYEHLLPSALSPAHQFITSYILPEAPITDIVDDCDPRFTEQSVDFYCPRAKLAIEIDGSQHELAAQSYLDIERDKYLEQNGIQTIRVATSDLDATRAANALVERFDFGKGPVTKIEGEIELAVFGYEIAMRAQVAIVECVRTGILDPRESTWEIELTCDQSGIDYETLFRAATSDVLDIFENLCVLLGREFTRPAVVLCDRADDLHLDVSATKFWSELESASGVVYVRNDYFEDRDNFEVACDEPIIYDTMSPERRDQVKKALMYFLKYLFDYDKFHDGQQDIIRRALARQATLGILPTGSGKSLCYQMACLLQPCISFVVCPIISLIQDQDRNAREKGFCRVDKIEGQMDRGDKNRVLEDFGRLRYQFIWIAPERFQMKDFRQRLREIGNGAHFAYAVIDEAHCLSEWGHDFRVPYLKLYDTLQNYCPEAVIIALTATASNNVRNDLLAELHIEESNIQSSSNLDREELSYHIIKISESEREAELSKVLDEINDTFCKRENIKTIFEPVGEGGKNSICGIIFSNTKSNPRRPYASCSGVISLLEKRGIRANEYHSDLGDNRTEIQQAFIDNEFTVMAATKAFGMGVNKKNVRYTIHDGLPWSIESFYQEAGRAGRDETRNASECYIIYSNDSPPETVAKVFAEDTTVEEIRELTNKLGGDLNTLFYLWSSNHEDVDIESQAIIGVFKELMRLRDDFGVAVIKFDLVRNMVFDAVIEKTKPGAKAELHMTTQDALYKLALLGIVKDWTVDYRTQTYEVSVEDIDSNSEQHVRDSLERYIRRHVPLFSFDSKSTAYKKYIDAYETAPEGNKLIGLVNALLLWTNDYILLRRRRAIQNMLEQCEKQPDKEEFRKYINNFFRLDTDSNNQLDNIVETADDVDVWFRLFTRLNNDPLNPKEKLKSIDEIEEISALCDRYRESYHANIGLEWATMVARLLSGRFSREETIQLFSFVARELGSYEGLDADVLFYRTLDLVEAASVEAKDAFGAAVVANASNRALDTYERLGDTSTLEHLVAMATADLRRIWGRTSGQ